MRESGPPYDDASETSDADVFLSVWPQLAAFLATPRTEAEVAEAFHLQAAEVQASLQRAVDEGLVRKSGKPARFERIHAADDSQGSLFEP